MTKLYKINDPEAGLMPAERYLADVNVSLRRITEVINNADAFKQVDARHRLRHLAETADSVCSELIRTAVTKVQP